MRQSVTEMADESVKETVTELDNKLGTEMAQVKVQSSEGVTKQEKEDSWVLESGQE